MIYHADVVLLSGHLRDVLLGRSIEQVETNVLNVYRTIVEDLAGRVNIIEEGSSLPSRPGTTMALQGKGLGKQEPVVRRGFDTFLKAVAKIVLGRNDITADTFIADNAIRQMILHDAVIG